MPAIICNSSYQVFTISKTARPLRYINTRNLLNKFILYIFFVIVYHGYSLCISFIFLLK